mgnify:CR=1 FL=1
MGGKQVAADDDDDDVPQLVGNFEDAANKKWDTILISNEVATIESSGSLTQSIELGN